MRVAWQHWCFGPPNYSDDQRSRRRATEFSGDGRDCFGPADGGRRGATSVCDLSALWRSLLWRRRRNSRSIRVRSEDSWGKTSVDSCTTTVAASPAKASRQAAHQGIPLSPTAAPAPTAETARVATALECCFMTRSLLTESGLRSSPDEKPRQS